MLYIHIYRKIKYVSPKYVLPFLNQIHVTMLQPTVCDVWCVCVRECTCVRVYLSLVGYVRACVREWTCSKFSSRQFTACFRLYRETRPDCFPSVTNDNEYQVIKDRKRMRWRFSKRNNIIVYFLSFCFFLFSLSRNIFKLLFQCLILIGYFVAKIETIVGL